MIRVCQGLFVDHRGRFLFVVIVFYSTAFVQKRVSIHFDFFLNFYIHFFFDPEFVGWISNPVTNVYHYLFANVHQGQIAVVPRKKPRTPLTFYCSFFQQQITLHTQHSVTFTVYIRCLMVSTNQADPNCFYFRISWILMERRWFYFFHPLHLMQGLRSLEYWLLQKLSMKNFDQKFRFLIKK